MPSSARSRRQSPYGTRLWTNVIKETLEEHAPMTDPRNQVPADAGPPPSDPDALREEIEATRAQLADTVDRLNVRSRARSAVVGLRDTATDIYRSRPPTMWAVAAAVAAIVAAIAWALSRRSTDE
jgi:Protein of unknown function (DUF3618)